MNRDEIKALQAEHGLYMVVRPDGSAKSIQPGCEPPEGCHVVAVKGAKTLTDAREAIKLAARAELLDDDDLEAIEDLDPTEAGKLRRARRRVKRVGGDL